MLPGGNNGKISHSYSRGTNMVHDIALRRSKLTNCIDIASEKSVGKEGKARSILDINTPSDIVSIVFLILAVGSVQVEELFSQIRAVYGH